MVDITRFRRLFYFIFLIFADLCPKDYNPEKGNCCKDLEIVGML